MEAMPTIYETNTTAISRRISDRNSFATSFYNSFVDVGIETDNQVTSYPELLPELFDSQELLKELNSSIGYSTEVGSTAVLVE